MDQVVDTETAKEFMKETLERVDPEELTHICAAVERKSAWFAGNLNEGLTEEDLLLALRAVFATRRSASGIMQQYSFEDLRSWILELLHGDADTQTRFQTFVDHLDQVPDNTRCDLASELLHFASPDKYWLWTRWMWDPRIRTGSLPLVTTAAYDLQGEGTAGEIYMKVGKAVAFVHEVGTAAGFQTISRSVFGTDVYLSCVYVIYAYTVLRMRMTQEFNKVMPGLPEFSRRLLGVHKRHKAAAQGAS